LGINKNNKVYISNDASEIIYEYYSNLFNNPERNIMRDNENTFTQIEFNEIYWENALKKLSLHKAVSIDECPDEIIKIPCFKEKLKNEFKIILKTGNVPLYWKKARLHLLTKIRNCSFPEIENTRPIIILCFMYKLLELYWAEECYDKIWNNIRKSQIGFRKHYSTHINISKIKKWIENAKQGYIIFVDITKAYDFVIREKLYDLLWHTTELCNTIQEYDV